MILKALEFAKAKHKNQFWKQSQRPLLYHPLAVSALVLRCGGDEAQATAALLHDTIGEPGADVASIEKDFGRDVAELTFAFSDPPTEAENPEWSTLKKAYLAKLEKISERALLVIACEELHEIQELVWDLRSEGPTTWKRYPVPDRDIAWYHRSLMQVFYRRLNTVPVKPLLGEYARLVRQLSEHVFEKAGI